MPAAGRSSGAPASSSTSCSPRPGWRARRSRSSTPSSAAPPANRKPRRGELANCRPWLAAQLELTDPAVIVALGGTAAEWFFGPAARIAALRALPEPPRYAGRPVVPTYHPSAAIRFGPNGEPRAALAADLALAARLAHASRSGDLP
jgi:DNA polymerase